MPTQQSQRNLIARMKLIPVHRLIKDKSLLMIDDSIVRGTQLRETTEFLYRNGAKEVHIRPACPPLLYGCKYLNFSRSKSEMDLITRRVIAKREGENVSDKVLADYADPNSTNYKEMLEEIRKEYMKLHNTNERNREIRDNLKRNFEKNSGLQKQYEIVGNLSKTANGNLSGSAKLDFETYIQRQYFRQIIRAANKRLVRMTSGEFILQCRDVEKLGSQGQAGLDLDVYHMATDTVRDVKTLSGGESFMAALSLSLIHI